MRMILKCIGYTFYFIYKSFLFFKNLIFNLLFIFLCILFINIFPIKKKNFTNDNLIKKNSVLEITINGSLNSLLESPTNNYCNFFLNNYFYISENNNSIFILAEKINQAILDKNIKAIILRLDNFTESNQPNLEYLGKYLQKFKDSGKKIFAIGKNYSQNQYYLASFSNKIYISKNGSIEFHGFSNEKLYFKNFLDFANIKAYVFRAGKYKSAVEPFLRNGISQYTKIRDQIWLNYLWINYLKKIYENRKISLLSNDSSSHSDKKDLKKDDECTNQYLKDRKLVDYILNKSDTYKNINQQLVAQYGENKFYSINIKNYHLIKNVNYDVNSTENNIHNKIAIIVNNGPIYNSKDTINNIDTEDTIRKIKIAKNDPEVKAIVFYINSPGGSLTASTEIQEEIENFKNSGKFFVTVMGGIAASGGYWISLPSNHIFANKNTITGSIGIFTIIYSIEKLMNSFGIYNDGVYTENVNPLKIYKDLTPEMEKSIQISITKGYEKFIRLVAKNRKKSIKNVEELANGKIWTGEEAKNNGLIDSIGDIDDAIKKAAELSKIKQYELLWISNKPKNIKLIFIESIKNNIVKIFEENIIENYCPYQIKKLFDELYKKCLQSMILNDPKNLYVIALY